MITKWRQMTAFVLSFALTVGWGVHGVAEAQQDVRIDLSNLVSTTAGNWNNISDVTGQTANLIDFNSGAGTGISIDGNGGPWSDFFGDDNGTFPNQDWLVQPATVDGAGLQNDTTGSYTFAGLNSSPYRVEVVSARPKFGYLNTITVDGALADRTFLGSPVNTPWDSTTDGLDAGNWLIWDNVQPNGGSITLVDVSGPGTLGILNAIRLFQVPEPSFALLLLSGLAVCLACRRRP